MRNGTVLSGVAVGLALGVGVLLGAWMRGRESAVGAAPQPAAAATAALAGAPALSVPPESTMDGDAPPGEGAGDGTSDVDRLRARSLSLPLPDLDPRLLRDSFGDPRSGGAHEALDIPAPRGTRVVAVEDGTVAKLFTSVRGGLTVYQFDPTSTYCYYYAHLDAYAPGLREGAVLRRGDLVGFVGTTGNAPPRTPHLHFAIFRLASPPLWWQGTAINPYPVWVRPG